MVTIHILLFGHYRDFAPDASGGALTLELSENEATPAKIAAMLTERDSRFSDLLTRTRIAVRAEFASANTRLLSGDEVAFLPPMSGG